MKIKKYLKGIRNQLKFNISYTSLIYDYINLFNRYRSENKLLKKIESEGGIVLSAEDLNKNIKNENGKVCHIIGLGWSLNGSMSIINRTNSFVIGMNNAALSGLEFDLYLMEPGDCSAERTGMYIRIIDDLLKAKKTNILMKNVYNCKYKNALFLLNHYGNRLNFIKNIGITCGNEKNINYWISKLLIYNPKYIVQYKSTVVTGIVLAKNAGFKEIVLHGVDFGGKYFYDEKKYDHLNNYKPASLEKYKLYEKTEDQLVHPTALKKGGLQDVLPILNNKLLIEGIKLYSATEISPLSKILPIYRS